MNKLPKVVFIGGIESGKTSTILSLWEENIQDFNIVSGVNFINVKELLAGREEIDFEVVELPRINYTSAEWVEKPFVKESLESADVIVYIVTCDEISINSRKQYLDNLLSSLSLKKDVVIILAYGMADWVLTPESAHNLQISKDELISLKAVSELLKKTNIVFNEFSCISKYDSTFGVNSVIPYSNALEWNVEELKYQIWDGLVLSMNNYVFDESLPTLVLSGKTGCGKTSTINALWNKDLAVNRAVSCTKFPAVMHIEDECMGEKIAFNLVDLPGIAESMEANSIYQKFYQKFISKADVIICLSQADRRAYKQDQMFYSDLIRTGVMNVGQNVILGINQADLLFKSKENPNGVDLHTISDDDQILTEKTTDYYDCIKDVFKGFEKVNADSVIIYSVFQSWHLNNLKQKIYKLLK